MTRDEAIATLDSMHRHAWTAGEEAPVVQAMRCLDKHGGLRAHAVERLLAALPGWYGAYDGELSELMYVQNMRHPGFSVATSPVWWPYPDELDTVRTCLEQACAAHVAQYGTAFRQYAIARVSDGDDGYTFTLHPEP